MVAPLNRRSLLRHAFAVSLIASSRAAAAASTCRVPAGDDRGPCLDYAPRGEYNEGVQQDLQGAQTRLLSAFVGALPTGDLPDTVRLEFLVDTATELTVEVSELTAGNGYVMDNYRPDATWPAHQIQSISWDAGLVLKRLKIPLGGLGELGYRVRRGSGARASNSEHVVPVFVNQAFTGQGPRDYHFVIEFGRTFEELEQTLCHRDNPSNCTTEPLHTTAISGSQRTFHARPPAMSADDSGHYILRIGGFDPLENKTRIFQDIDFYHHVGGP